MYSTPAFLQSSISFFRIGDVGFGAAELLEAAAGAGNADRHLDGALLRLLELLGDGFGDRVDGRRAVDLDDLLRERRRGGGAGGAKGERSGDDRKLGFHADSWGEVRGNDTDGDRAYGRLVTGS
jgi:hypothetical protein